MMRRIGAVTLVLMLGLAVGAWAGDVAGKIQSVDAGDRVIVLDDGTKLWVGEGVPIDTLKEGANVKASFEDRDGKNVVTTIEVE